MRRLFDTTFLVHYLTRPAEVETYLTEHEPPETSLYATVISLKELAVGLHRVEDEPAIADLEHDFGWLEVLPFTTEHAYHAGHIEHELRTRGLPQDRLTALGGDILIGGVARAEDTPVVTRNVDDFRPMPGVRVDRY